VDSAKRDDCSCCKSSGHAVTGTLSWASGLDYRPVQTPHRHRAAMSACRDSRWQSLYGRVSRRDVCGRAEAINPGESAEVSLALIYFPEKSYDEVKPGATFTIREGPVIVGFGAIAARSPSNQEREP
jgi:hypothetical protein